MIVSDKSRVTKKVDILSFYKP